MNAEINCKIADGEMTFDVKTQWGDVQMTVPVQSWWVELDKPPDPHKAALMSWDGGHLYIESIGMVKFGYQMSEDTIANMERHEREEHDQERERLGGWMLDGPALPHTITNSRTGVVYDNMDKAEVASEDGDTFRIDLK